MQGLRTQLIELLHEKTIAGRKKGNQYTCIYAGYKCVIFDSNSNSKKIMLPMDVIIEWIEAYRSGEIYPEYSSKLKRKTVTENSPWSTTLHSFESHLTAILDAYIEQYV